MEEKKITNREENVESQKLQEPNSQNSNKNMRPMTQEEIDMFTSQLASKISDITQKKIRRKPRKGFLGINPFIMIVTSLMLIFLFFGVFLRDPGAQKIPLTRVVEGLQNNEYSQVLVRNNGTIGVKDKSFVYANSISDETFRKILNGSVIRSIYEGERLKEISFGEAVELFKSDDLITRIRSLFSVVGEKASRVVFIKDTGILIYTSKREFAYFVPNMSREDFISSLQDKKINIDSLNVEFGDLNTLAKSVAQTSIQSRVDSSQIVSLTKVGDLVLAEINPSLVKTYDFDWSANIASFTAYLGSIGFDINNENLGFEILTVNVAEGITFDTILTILTIAAFVFIGFVIFRSAQSSGMGIMQFGQSKAKMFWGQKTGVTFKDVAGIDEAREELNEIVDFLRNPSKYRKLGARIPKGILMFGPPGTGKTLLARAIAGEASVPFFHTSGSEFEEMLVGAGASRVRDLFAKAKKAAPSLIFIDEIDAVARKRGTRIQSGTTEQTLNQILVEMDGFEKNTNVIVIAATNRPDVLDDAILRPGRFDRQVRIEPPDKDGRFEILKLHTKNKPISKTVDLEKFAKRTVGFTGADLENIMNEAAIISAKANKTEITEQEIDDALQKVVLGPAKKTRKRTEEEIKLVAYHEAGHALVAKLTEWATPVEKISIVSRGNSGGVTMFLPEKDENILSMKKLMASIRVSLGGRAAEEIVLSDISTGASGDIESATRTARAMVQKFGMSKKLGLVNYGSVDEADYVGYHYGDKNFLSEDTTKQIDSEVREIIASEYESAKKILRENIDMLHKIAKALMEKEVLDKEEFNALFNQ